MPHNIFITSHPHCTARRPAYKAKPQEIT